VSQHGAILSQLPARLNLRQGQLAWLIIAAAFYQKPELLTWLQRGIQRSMEIVGDSIPSPWGPRIEFVFREIGGFIWLQITAIVIFLRVTMSGIASAWRLLRRRDPAL
jgi:hypothetical protein